MVSLEYFLTSVLSQSRFSNHVCTVTPFFYIYLYENFLDKSKYADIEGVSYCLGLISLSLGGPGEWRALNVPSSNSYIVDHEMGNIFEEKYKTPKLSFFIVPAIISCKHKILLCNSQIV